MSAHTCTTFDPTCYRCDLNRDEVTDHPCPADGCRLSAEEHHRVNVGLVAENAELRRRLRDNQVTDPLAERKAALMQHVEDFLAGKQPADNAPALP